MPALGAGIFYESILLKLELKLRYKENGKMRSLSFRLQNLTYYSKNSPSSSGGGMNCNRDLVGGILSKIEHMFLKYNPFSAIIYSVKMKEKEYPEIRQKSWKETFRSQSFCLISAGGAPIEVIRQYIETQGEKDGKKSQSISVQDIPNF